MIRIIYDAVNGTPYRDGDAAQVIEDVIAKGEALIVTASECVVHAARVAVRGGRLPLDKCQIEHRTDKGDRVLKLYQDGGIDPWPAGFCDTIEKFILKLF